MGFDLGLLAAAYQGARKEYRQWQDDEYQQAVRDYDLANRKEHADTREARLAAENARLQDAVAVYQQRAELRPEQTVTEKAGLADRQAQYEANARIRPVQTEASISRYQLDDATNEANRELVPGDLSNKKTTQQIQGNDLRFQQSQQPVIQQAKGIGNKTAVTQAQTGAVKAGIDFNLMNAEARMTPDKITQAYIGQTLSTDQARNMALGGFAQRLHANDTDGAVQFVNEIIGKTDLFPGAKGKKVAKIEQVYNDAGNSWTAVMLDSKGKVIGEVPKERLVQAYQSGIGKAEIRDLAPGHKVVGIRNGQAVDIAENPKDPMTSEHAPADLKMFNFLTGRDPRNQINKPMTDDQALDWIRTAKGKSESEFIATAMSMDFTASQLPPAEKQKKVEEWRQVYRAAKSGEGGGLSGASNSSGGTTVSPQIRALVTGN